MSRSILVTLLLGASACGGDDGASYCDGHPDDQANCPAPDAGKCTTNDQCSGEVCDTASGDCVECTTAQASACMATTPVCGDDNTCTACTTHADCTASNVCLPTGACADESQVAYVSASGTGTACTKAAPCPLLASAVAKPLPYIKIAADGAAKAGAPVVIDGKAVTILAAPGAILDRDGDGPILEVKSAGADVQIFDLQVSGASGTTDANGIVLTPNVGNPKLSLTRVKVSGNAGIGISAPGGTLSIAQSTISGNTGIGISASGGSLSVMQSTISLNTGGGISVTSGTFDITNNFIYRNGNPDTGVVAGVHLNVATGPQSRVEFNTIVDNRVSTSATRAGGLVCDITGFAASNNIIARNALGTSTTATNAQVIGQCTYPSSKIQSDVTGLAFAQSEMTPFDYHLTAGSSAIDAAGTASSIVVDVDAQPRPSGAQKDCGADEYAP